MLWVVEEILGLIKLAYTVTLGLGCLVVSGDSLRLLIESTYYFFSNETWGMSQNNELYIYIAFKFINEGYRPILGPDLKLYETLPNSFQVYGGIFRWPEPLNQPKFG